MNGVTDPPLWSTTTEYDHLGQAVRETDRHEKPTETIYDARGLVIESRRQVRDELGLNVWLTTRTLYDAAGQVEYVTESEITHRRGRRRTGPTGPC